MEEEGSEYNLGCADLWSSTCFSHHCIVEVHIPSTSLGKELEVWASFLVTDVQLNMEGEVVLEAKSLGCADPEVTKILSGMFNRRRGLLRLCHSVECTWGESVVLHVHRLRRWSTQGFSRDYLTASMKRQLAKWLGEEDGDEEQPPEEEPPSFPPEPAGPTEEHASGPDDFEILGGAAGVKEGVPAKTTPKRPSALKKKGPDPDREKIRAKLDSVRRRVVGASPLDRRPAGKAVPGNRGEEVNLVESSSEQMSPGVGEELAKELSAPVRETRGDLGNPFPLDRGPLAAKEKGKKKPKRQAVPDGPPLAMVPVEKATKGSSMSSYQTQLGKIAAEEAQHRDRRKREEKKKSAKKDPGKQLVRALTKVVSKKEDRSGSSSKKITKIKKEGEKDKRKKKKRKTRLGGSSGGSPSSSSPDGSDYGEESEDTDRSSGSSTRKRVEAPLRRRSRKHPGSVLMLLLEHARAQLDQSATVLVQEDKLSDITGGVRMTSYFNILIKPTLTGSMAQAREMNHLSNAIDLLRRGQLHHLGDLLAGRFMSLHQSVIDGGWVAARHLELMPMEETSAAGPAIVLETRRHAKLAAKAQGFEGWNYTTSSRPKGGKGKAGSWEYQNDAKGKSKKGGKSKGKGKGGWPNPPHSDLEASIPKKQEKPADK